MKTKKIQLLVLLTILVFRVCIGQNSTTPGEVESYQTPYSIGIEWHLTGDGNHNAVCSVKYKNKTDSEWKDALPLYRIDFKEKDMMAGSIMHLEPATTYEVKLSLSDIDGGANTQTIEIKTRDLPQLPSNGNTYYVAPGNGGGTGSSDDPFLGIEKAQSIAVPGDIFLLNSGEYASGSDNGKIQFTKSGEPENYIAWKAADNASPVLAGARIDCDYIWLEGVTIMDQEHGILVGSNVPKGIVITKNYFKGCYNSIYLNHGGENWHITDNVIEGNIPDFTTGEFGGEGVELWHSDGCVVAFNKIYNTADGVSYPGKNCDIFRNEIYNVSDDGIELDYGYENNRAWENRITNANNNGISFQPMNGAPMYVIRNQVYVHGENALKLRDDVDRALIAHNTFVCWSGAMASGSNLLVGLHSNNNLWISVSDRYVWEDGSSSTTTDWRTNLDYDGFDWNNNSLAFKWGGERLATLEDFQAFSGLETNGVRVKKDEIFENYSFAEVPQPSPLQYLTLKENCNAVDAGTTLNNINDNYSGTAPDLGAFEYGSELPGYGPRFDVVSNIAKTHKNKIQLACSPNPLNNESKVQLQIPLKTHVKLEVIDINGRLVAQLSNQVLLPGKHEFSLNANTGKLTESLYLVCLTTKNQVETIKIILNRED
jgi:hypothetical protein